MSYHKDINYHSTLFEFSNKKIFKIIEVNCLKASTQDDEKREEN